MKEECQTTKTEVVRLMLCAFFQALPLTSCAGDDEIIQSSDAHKLMGKGLGYIDIPVLVSALLTRIPLWTIDNQLHETSLTLLSSH